MKLIDADNLKKRIVECCIDGDAEAEKWYSIMGINDAIDDAPTIEIVRCRDCIFYTKPHIQFNDGTKRFFDDEKEIEFVTADVGTNIGGKCVGHKIYCTAHDREDPEDNEEIVVFRYTNDFCSYGRCEKKTEGAEYEID